MVSPLGGARRLHRFTAHKQNQLKRAEALVITQNSRMRTGEMWVMTSLETTG